MGRQAAAIAIEERPGSQYADLATAQRVALHPLAADLAATVRALLASGELVAREGRITTREEEASIDPEP